MSKGGATYLTAANQRELAPALVATFANERSQLPRIAATVLRTVVAALGDDAAPLVERMLKELVRLAGGGNSTLSRANMAAALSIAQYVHSPRLVPELSRAWAEHKARENVRSTVYRAINIMLAHWSDENWARIGKEPSSEVAGLLVQGMSDASENLRRVGRLNFRLFALRFPDAATPLLRLLRDPKRDPAKLLADEAVKDVAFAVAEASAVVAAASGPLSTSSSTSGGDDNDTFIFARVTIMIGEEASSAAAITAALHPATVAASYAAPAAAATSAAAAASTNARVAAASGKPVVAVAKAAAAAAGGAGAAGASIPSDSRRGSETASTDAATVPPQQAVVEKPQPPALPLRALPNSSINGATASGDAGSSGTSSARSRSGAGSARDGACTGGSSNEPGPLHAGHPSEFEEEQIAPGTAPGKVCRELNQHLGALVRQQIAAMGTAITQQYRTMETKVLAAQRQAAGTPAGAAAALQAADVVLAGAGARGRNLERQASSGELGSGSTFEPSIPVTDAAAYADSVLEFAAAQIAVLQELQAHAAAAQRYLARLASTTSQGGAPASANGHSGSE